MKQTIKIATLIVSMTLLAGCVVRVNSDGIGVFDTERVEETQSIEGVGEVIMGARGNLHILQGESESLRVEGPKSAVEDLKIYQKGNVLIIEERMDFSPLIRWSYPDRVDVYLNVQSIDAITLNGHGDVNMQKLNADSLHLDVKGHGDMYFGKIVADTLFLTLEGHGDINVDEAVARRIETELAGHGNIHVDFLDADRVGVDIDGHGEVKLAGKTVVQRVEVDGHGDYSGNDLSSQETDVTVTGHGSAEVWATEVLSMDVDRHATIRYRGNPKVYSLGDNVTHLGMK